MKAELSDRYKVLFIVFVSLGVYYPSLFGEFNTIDDRSMLTVLTNTLSVDWGSLFFPENAHHYYRPVLWLSYYVDRFLFGSSEFFMHLHNVLLHTLNGLLVFLIMRVVLKRMQAERDAYTAMFVSLLFVLHPVNTESVNWISGRTDVLAMVFILVSLLVFISKGLGRPWWCWGAAALYLLGLLSKESAIPLLPVIGIILVMRTRVIDELSLGTKSRMFLPFIVVTVVYFLMRSAGPGFSETGLTTAGTSILGGDLLGSLRILVEVFGFYLKKLIIPFPLNFGIVEINHVLYFWVGACSIVAGLYLLIKRKGLKSFFLLFSIAFFLPALAAALVRFSWTPVAERYLYASSFGVAAFVVLTLTEVLQSRWKVVASVCAVLVVCSFVVVERNVIWQRNLTLYEDTVKKSPTFTAARNEYGCALIRQGRENEGLEQLEIAAQQVPNGNYKELPAINLVQFSSQRRDPEEVKKDYLKLLEGADSPVATTVILNKLIKTIEQQTIKEKDAERRKALHRENVLYFQKLFAVDKNGFYLYRLGQLHLFLDERTEAVECFRRAVEMSPNEYFSDPARKLISRLNGTKT